jgi:hypothetical protein
VPVVQRVVQNTSKFIVGLVGQGIQAGRC